MDAIFLRYASLQHLRIPPYSDIDMDLMATSVTAIVPITTSIIKHTPGLEKPYSGHAWLCVHSFNSTSYFPQVFMPAGCTVKLRKQLIDISSSFPNIVADRQLIAAVGARCHRRLQRPPSENPRNSRRLATFSAERSAWRKTPYTRRA